MADVQGFVTLAVPHAALATSKPGVIPAWNDHNKPPPDAVVACSTRSPQEGMLLRCNSDDEVHSF